MTVNTYDPWQPTELQQFCAAAFFVAVIAYQVWYWVSFYLKVLRRRGKG